VRRKRVVDDACYYTPGRVAYWLESWRSLQELALPTAPAITYDRVSQVPEGMRLSDPTKYTDVLVDLERAWINLGHRHGELVTVTEYAMQGRHMREIEDSLRIRHGLGEELFRRACERMAEHLGWRR
jgi:hypothetical protein